MGQERTCLEHGLPLPPSGQSELWARGANTEVTCPPPSLSSSLTLLSLSFPSFLLSGLQLLNGTVYVTVVSHACPHTALLLSAKGGEPSGPMWGAVGTPLPWGGVTAGRAVGCHALLASVAMGRCAVLTPDCCRCSLFSSVESQSVLSTSLIVSFPLCLPSSLLSWAALGPDSCSIGIEE